MFSVRAEEAGCAFTRQYADTRGGGCRRYMDSVLILVHGGEGHHPILPCVPVDLRVVVRCTDTRFPLLMFIDRYAAICRQLFYTIFRASKGEAVRYSTVLWRVESSTASASLLYHSLCM